MKTLRKQQAAASTGRKAAEERVRSMWRVPLPLPPFATIQSREPWRRGKEAWRKGAAGNTEEEREKGSGGGEDVGRAGAGIKFDLLRR